MSTDPLTAIQTSLDQLATQFYASLRYLSSHHPSSSLTHTNNAAAGGPYPPTDTSPLHRPDSPATFVAAQKELAQDLVLKVQEIETLIEKLPGLGESVESQEGRIRRLEEEMRVVEAGRVDAVREREMCMEIVEEVVGRVKR
ncbi:MAG: hypothetical protein Q9183_001936 [Haloplaca sp. 2 TL-2023]